MKGNGRGFVLFFLLMWRICVLRVFFSRFVWYL
jgi:hypothetical protein